MVQGCSRLRLLRLTEAGIHRYDSTGLSIFDIEYARTVILIHRHSAKGEWV